MAKRKSHRVQAKKPKSLAGVRPHKSLGQRSSRPLLMRAA